MTSAPGYHGARADDYAERGLNGDQYDHDDRMRLLAYANVHATLAVVEQVKRVAESLAWLTARRIEDDARARPAVCPDCRHDVIAQPLSPMIDGRRLVECPQCSRQWTQTVVVT